MDQHLFGIDQGVRFDLDYVPLGQSQTFTFSPTSSNTTMHLYGFANAIVPEPSTFAIVAIATLIVGQRRRRS